MPVAVRVACGLLLLMFAGACGGVDDRAATEAPATDEELDGDPDAAVQLELLAVRTWQFGGLALVDLERGETTLLRQGRSGMSRDPVYGAALTVDGVVVFWQDGVVTAVRPHTGAVLLVHRPDELINPSWAAPAVNAMPTLDGRLLWVVQPGIGCCGEHIDGQAELVELASGRVLLTAALPPNTVGAAVMPHGLVLNILRYVDTGDGWVDEPGSHAILELTLDGDLNHLRAGTAIAGSGTSILVHDCADAPLAQPCELRLFDAQTGREREIPRPIDGHWTTVAGPDIPINSPGWRTTSRMGRILLGITVPSQDDPHRKPVESYLVTVDPDDPDGVEVLDRFEGRLPLVAWERTGERVVLIGDGHDPTMGDVTVLDPASGSSFTLRDAIPSGYSVLFAR